MSKLYMYPLTEINVVKQYKTCACICTAEVGIKTSQEIMSVKGYIMPLFDGEF